MGKTYSGICYACKRESQYLEKDHRVSPRLGGSNNQMNLQDLCLECHRRKSYLESTLMTFNCETETVINWFKLAFQNEPQLVHIFITELYLRANHFKEVAREAGIIDIDKFTQDARERQKRDFPTLADWLSDDEKKLM